MAVSRGKKETDGSLSVGFGNYRKYFSVFYGFLMAYFFDKISVEQLHKLFFVKGVGSSAEAALDLKLPFLSLG